MNKTRFKAFFCSFVLSLSAILIVDRAFFYTPEPAEDNVKIPRKNIALFFSDSSLQAHPYHTEPVVVAALETPEREDIDFSVASATDTDSDIQDEIKISEYDDIPLQIADMPSEEQVQVAQNDAPEKQTSEAETPEFPLIYAGQDELLEKPSPAPQKAEESTASAPVKIASAEPIKEEDLLNKSIVVQATRQIFKIDNLKKYRERHNIKQQDPPSEMALNEPAEKVVLAENDDIIPLQNSSEEIYLIDEDSSASPAPNQIASLGGNISLTEAKEQVDESKEDSHWETMAEKNGEETPWVVARGSKFVKNKQSLKEGYASDAAKKKAVANRDLWERLDALIQYRYITFNWVKAHNKNLMNERCDLLARTAATKFKNGG